MLCYCAFEDDFSVSGQSGTRFTTKQLFTLNYAHLMERTTVILIKYEAWYTPCIAISLNLFIL